MTRIALFLALLPLSLAAAEPAPAGKHFLWKVTSEGGTAWLLGSIHLGDESLYPLPEVMESAFAASEVVAVEADVRQAQSPGAQTLLIKHATYSDGSTLKDHLPKERYAELAKRVEDAGLSLEMLARFKPWFVALTLMTTALQKAGIRGTEGIESHFLAKAEKRAMPVVELEGLEYQVKLFDSFDSALQTAFLDYTLDDMETLSEETRALLAAWKRGDLEAIQTITSESLDEHPTLAKALFDDRNEAMAEKVRGFLSTGKTHFVIVGAAHMVGPKGLVALLRGSGLTVVRH